MAAWSAKLRHRARRERRGAHAIEFKSRASTDEVGGSRRRAHTTGEREAAEAQGNTLTHSSRSSVEPVQGSGGVHAREGRQLSDSERTAFAKCVHFARVAGQASVADVCKEWGISVSWIQDLESVANGGERPVSTKKWAPTRIDGGGHEDA